MGVSRQSVMDQFAVSYDQVNRAENNQSHGLLIRLIDHYSANWLIPTAWFYDGEFSQPPSGQPSKPEVTYPVNQVTEKPSRYQPGDYANLPVWRSVYASDLDEFGYEEQGQHDTEAIPALFLDADPEQFFLAQVVGHSLEDLAYTGDLLLVRRTVSPGLHSLVIAQSPGKKSVCKILRPGKTQPFELHSYNKDHGANFTDIRDWVFIGEVRAIFLKSKVPPQPNIVWDSHRAIRVPL